jgi:hypothetical protein
VRVKLIVVTAFSVDGQSELSMGRGSANGMTDGVSAEGLLGAAGVSSWMRALLIDGAGAHKDGRKWHCSTVAHRRRLHSGAGRGAEAGRRRAMAKRLGFSLRS